MAKGKVYSVIYDREQALKMFNQLAAVNPKLAEEIKKQRGWIEESAWQWADKVLELREKNLG